jgi:hypothetical protein
MWSWDSLVRVKISCVLDSRGIGSIIANKKLFIFNSQVHNWHTRSTYDLHYPQTNLSHFQKGICYMGTKIFNHLPTKIKSMSSDLKSFKLQLTTFLLQNSFYAIEEFILRKPVQK